MVNKTLPSFGHQCGNFLRSSSANTCGTESVEDEDEVLVALSAELGNFIEYVGGPSWGHVLLSPLENLAAIEEPVVRDKVSGMLYLCTSLLRSVANKTLGRRVPEQDLRGALAKTSRRVLRPPHIPTLQGRLVHVQGVGLRSVHSTLQEGLGQHSTAAPPPIRPASPR